MGMQLAIRRFNLAIQSDDGSTASDDLPRDSQLSAVRQDRANEFHGRVSCVGRHCAGSRTLWAARAMAVSSIVMLHPP